MKVHVIFLYTQPFTHKLHLKMGLGPFLEQSSTVKFPSLFEPPKGGMEIKMNKTIWHELYDTAKQKLNPRVLTPFVDAGGVAAAILTDKGNVYTGACIDTCSGLGMCAERNAIANMITNGESCIVGLVCVMTDGRVGSPCGACREMLMQIDAHSPEIEILTDLETLSTVRLGDLVPDWWGAERMQRG